MKGGNRFGEFIANLRKENDISQDKLCDGLCTRSMICKFEKGEREPDKLLQNRFLTRLGVVPENYENFLYYEDYCRWEKQQGIIHNILEEHMDEAKKLLEAYRLEYDMSIPLEEQFYLAGRRISGTVSLCVVFDRTEAGTAWLYRAAVVSGRTESAAGILLLQQGTAATL